MLKSPAGRTRNLPAASASSPTHGDKYNNLQTAKSPDGTTFAVLQNYKCSRGVAQAAMSEMTEVVAEVESAMNSVAVLDGADVRSFARNDDGSIDITVRVNAGEAPDAGDEPATDPEPETEAPSDKTQDGKATTDDFDPRDALAQIRQAKAGETEADEAESQDDDGNCGAETNDGTPCQLPADACPHHDDAGDPAPEADDDDDDGPSTPLGFALANGPCVAAGDADGETPCGYGAHPDHDGMCPVHGRMDGPALFEPALEARVAWDDGDVDAVRAFMDANGA